MIARDQLRSVVDRIIRLKEEQDAIGADVREVYAEAKSNGYDNTALGRLVNHLRKVAKKGASEVTEADAIFDLYLTTYEGPSRTHAHARESDTIPRESNQGKTDTAGRNNTAPSDGVVSRTSGGVDTPATITEPAPPAEPEVAAATAGQGTDPPSDALPADTQSQPGRSEAPRQIEAGLVAKVEDQSTAARKDVPGSLPVIENGPVLSDNGGRYPVNGEAKVLAASSEVPGTPAGIKPRPSILTIAFLAPLFDYDPETGFVSWKIDFGTAKAGDRAGHVRPSGYRMIQIDGRRYQEHRIAWVLTHGDLPADGRQIDHANQVKDDNRLANLRAATRAEQQINSPTQSNNLHGRGVGWRADRGVWRADIYVNNARVFLGHFEHREDAQAAYEDAAREYYGEFAPQAPPVDTPKKLIKLAPDRADEIGELLDQREAAQ